jgi:hypothetical protein
VGLHFVVLGIEGLVADAEGFDEFFDRHGVVVFAKVTLEGHQVSGLLEPEGQFFGHQQEIVVVDYRIF